MTSKLFIILLQTNSNIYQLLGAHEHVFSSNFEILEHLAEGGGHMHEQLEESHIFRSVHALMIGQVFFTQAQRE
jgi:hypothetical protein